MSPSVKYMAGRSKGVTFETLERENEAAKKLSPGQSGSALEKRVEKNL